MLKEYFFSHFGACLESSLIFAKKYFVQTAPHSEFPAKACNLLQIFSSSLKSKNLCQLTNQCHQNEKSLCHCSQTRYSKCLVMLSISVYYLMYGITVWITVTVLKCRRLHNLCMAYIHFKSYNLHITVRGIFIVGDQYLAASFSQCKP